VLLVDGEDIVWEPSAGAGVGSGEAEGAPEERAWVSAQRVEVEVVDCVG
jgi:hypothetical protein